MTLPSYYNTGTASVGAGGSTVTFSGAALGSDEFPFIQGGDSFAAPAQPLVPPQRIASVDYEASTVALWAPWPGTALAAAPYEIRLIGDAARSSAQTRRLLEQLSVVAANGRGLFYRFSSTVTDADPGGGFLRLNNLMIGSATAAFLDTLDANGATVSTIIETWDDGGNSGGRGQLWLRSIADPSDFHAFTVTGSVTTATGYRKLALTYVGGSGTFANNDELMVDFVPVGGFSQFTPASAAGPASFDLLEDTDNGTNKITVKGQAALAADRVFTLPDATGTALVGALGGTDNAIVRADGTGGATAQGSAPTIDDSGNVAGVGTFTATGTVETSGVLSSSRFAAAAQYQMKRASGSAGSPSQVDSAAQVGGFYVYAYDDAAAYRQIGAFLVNATGAITTGATPTSMVFHTGNAASGTISARVTIATGLLMNGATGGDKGPITINAGAVYDDNVLLTCQPLSEEFLATGTIDTDTWDATLPPTIIPEERHEVPRLELREVTEEVTERQGAGFVRRQVTRTRQVEVVEVLPLRNEAGEQIGSIEVPVMDEVVVPAQVLPRRHHVAHLFKRMLDDGFDPRSPAAYIARLKADGALPGMPTRANWKQNEIGSGEMLCRLWLATEMLALVVMNHEARLAQLEG